MAAPTGPSDRQLARERGEALLDQVAEHFVGVPGVQVGRMFNGRGLSVDDSIFVFINRDGRLVAKLPESEARTRVAAGDADLVTMGTRTMREWVSFAQPAALDSWVSVARDAHRYVSALTS
jgi:TfoX/Sxy family transcriptional regulator of competence genes